MKGFFYKYLPELLFGFLFLFVYLPYFIYTPVPYVLNDMFAYFYVAKDFSEGLIPLSGYTFDTPYGLGFFIYLVYSFGGNIDTVILLQTLLNVSIFLLLIHELKKYNYKVAIISAALLGCYMALSDTLLWNTLIYSESLYISGVGFVVFALLRHHRVGEIKDIWFILLGILFLLYIRSIAIYLFFIPVLLLFFSWIKKDGKTKHILMALFIILLINSMTNWIVKGYFAPGEVYRMVDVIEKHFKADSLPSENNPTEEIVIALEKPSKLKQALKVFTNLKNAEMGNFYYYRIPFVYAEFKKEKLELFVENKIFYKEEKSSEELVAFLLKDYNFNKKAFEEIENITDIDKKPRHFWLYSNHLVHLLRYVWRNWLFIIAFYLIYGMGIVQVVKRSFNKMKIKKEWKAIFYLGSIHFLSMCLLASISPRDTSLSRYVIVTEFVAYIVIAFGLILFYDKYSKQRTKGVSGLNK